MTLVSRFGEPAWPPSEDGGDIALCLMVTNHPSGTRGRTDFFTGLFGGGEEVITGFVLSLRREEDAAKIESALIDDMSYAQKARYVVDHHARDIVVAHFYQDGLKNPGPNGEWAAQSYCPNGALGFRSWWKNGKGENAPHGRGCSEYWNSRRELLRVDLFLEDGVTCIGMTQPQGLRNYLENARHLESSAKTTAKPLRHCM